MDTRVYMHELYSYIYNYSQFAYTVSAAAKIWSLPISYRAEDWGYAYCSSRWTTLYKARGKAGLIVRIWY